MSNNHRQAGPVEVNGRLWWPYACRFESPDGAFEFQIHALSEDHAQILLDDLRKTATVLGRIERQGPLR